MKQLVVIAFVALLVGVHWYFRTRADKPVSAVERGLATGWLWVRRITCFFAAAVALLGALSLIAHGILTDVDMMLIIGTVLLLALAALFTHWGVYGMGVRRYDTRDDRPVHEARAKRYGWRRS
ncbi:MULTISPECIES: hypothetical protein [Dyella]|uniref:DUF3325 domain-containing protein n=2 Tax=Dyella TaxID=231454 RepID=A0A4V2NLD5_9GAMM|nr:MULTISPECIES: hypothetical protein [Dyella]TBR36444.1 hypothetical protein EYV96_10890 [Dyella terrae]TCI08464.1 hypothetical protein EZM97_27980 [Dyella soli]